MKYLCDIDLSTYEIKNVRIHNSSDPPSDPKAGMLYYDTDDNSLKYYDGTEWAPVGSSIASTIASVSGIIKSDGLGSFSAAVEGTDFAAASHTHTDLAPLASPALTGTPTAVTPALADDSTKIATTEWIKDYIPTPVSVANGGTGLQTVANGSYLKGNGAGDLIQRTVAQVRSDLGIVDYVSETGTNSGWSYEKYNSGKLVMYRSDLAVEGVATSNILVGGYYTYADLSIPSMFYSKPHGFLDAMPGSGGAGWAYMIPVSSTKVSIGAVGNMNSSTINIEYIELIGRWKA